MIAQDELIEYARYVNHYYGTPRSYVEEQFGEWKDVILEIEIQGVAEGEGEISGYALSLYYPSKCQRASQTSDRTGDRSPWK